jgi:CheY-like chemotaxis protein
MNTCKILIIDDDTDDIEILSDAFKSSGVDSVHYVYSAMQAFMYLEGFKNKEDLPKLIVTDIYLPGGITGAEFLVDLKTMDSYKHIHVIVLSSVKTDKEVEKYRLLGAVDYLVKPSTYQEYVKIAADITSKLNV